MPSKHTYGILEVTELDPRTMTPHTRHLPTLTCCHCNRVVVLNPERRRERHWCFKCDAYICDSPGCNSDCNPIEEGVDLALKYPDLAQPFLLRDDQGYTMFDLSLRDKERPH